MTTRRPATTLPGAAAGASPPPLPDPPRRNDMRQTENFELLAVMNTVARFFDALRGDSSVLVSGNGYVCATRSELPSAPYPDMVVAFGVDRATLTGNNGYEIDRVGKPPDFVLEVASEHTGRRDYTTKRDDYARLGILEYWRFDYTGGRFHDAPLAGDRLANGAYQRIEITPDIDGVLWGYSEALELYLCWTGAGSGSTTGEHGPSCKTHRNWRRTGMLQEPPSGSPKPASASWNRNCNAAGRNRTITTCCWPAAAAATSTSRATPARRGASSTGSSARFPR